MIEKGNQINTPQLLVSSSSSSSTHNHYNHHYLVSVTAALRFEHLPLLSVIQHKLANNNNNNSKHLPQMASLTSPTTIKIAALSGSLRAGSFNHRLLQAAAKLLPDEFVTLDIIGYSDLPFFSQDLESESLLPKSVKTFRETISQYDAVLFATPEYNGSFPGILKNAIDWGSRPYGQSSWKGKAVGFMGATPANYAGSPGTGRAQHHLRQVTGLLNMLPVLQPEVLMTNSYENFDAEGNLTNEFYKQRITDHLKELVKLARMTKSYHEFY